MTTIDNALETELLLRDLGHSKMCFMNVFPAVEYSKLQLEGIHHGWPTTGLTEKHYQECTPSPSTACPPSRGWELTAPAGSRGRPVAAPPVICLALQSDFFMWCDRKANFSLV